MEGEIREGVGRLFGGEEKSAWRERLEGLEGEVREGVGRLYEGVKKSACMEGQIRVSEGRGHRGSGKIVRRMKGR